MCRWLTSYVPPLSISSIVVSLWLAGCLAKSTLIGWREYYGGGGVGVDDTCVEPSKREDLTQCCFNIGPPPTALDQHWNNIGSSPRVCWESCPHFDTPVPSVSGWNRLHSALCSNKTEVNCIYNFAFLRDFTYIFYYLKYSKMRSLIDIITKCTACYYMTFII